MVNKDIIIAQLLQQNQQQADQIRLLTEQNLQLHSEVQQLKEKIDPMDSFCQDQSRAFTNGMEIKHLIDDLIMELGCNEVKNKQIEELLELI